jgi:hypothetical protein
VRIGGQSGLPSKYGNRQPLKFKPEDSGKINVDEGTPVRLSLPATETLKANVGSECAEAKRKENCLTQMQKGRKQLQTIRRRWG